MIAAPEDAEGFFRTEVRSTLNKLNVEGGILTCDRITLGLVSMYRRQWFDNGKPHATRVRVVPLGCSIENLVVKGIPVKDFLPRAFPLLRGPMRSLLARQRSRLHRQRGRACRHYRHSHALTLREEFW